MATPPRKSARYPAVKTISVYTPNVLKHDLSRERIAEDVAAFRSAGGKIEVLGNTPFRMKSNLPTPIVDRKSSPHVGALPSATVGPSAASETRCQEPRESSSMPGGVCGAA